MLDIKLDPSPAQIVQRLDTFADDLQNKALTSGLTGAAAPVKKRMKALAPKRRGALAKSVSHRQLSRSAKARLGVPTEQKAVLVGPIAKVADPGYRHAPGKKIAQGFKALWMEYGTRPHRIPKQGKRSTFKKRKALSFGGRVVSSVAHPGTRPRPFIGPAYQATGNATAAGFYQAMARYLDRKANA